MMISSRDSSCEEPIFERIRKIMFHFIHQFLGKYAAIPDSRWEPFMPNYGVDPL